MKWTRTGSREFHQGIDAILQDIASDVKSFLGEDLMALILGGGYGRGEGGLLLINGSQELYNDLDFFLFVRPGARIDRQALDAVFHRHATALGIHVDCSRPYGTDEIPRLPRALLWYDMVQGHAVVAGPKHFVLQRFPKHLWEPPPAVEAARLLLNRGAALVWAMRVQQGLEPAPDDDFVRRNAWKGFHAAGDALLILHGRYQSQYHGRPELLGGLAADRFDIADMDLLDDYRNAVTFRELPDSIPEVAWDRDALRRVATTWGCVFDAVERRRHGRRWANWESYARWDGVREPDMDRPDRWPRQLVQNLRSHRLSLLSPREDLYRRLPLLLGLGDNLPGEWQQKSASFLEDWKRTI